MEAGSPHSCQPGCSAAVPQELAVESVCIQHFILRIEQSCADMRREAAKERASQTRTREIEAYVKSTALKLSDVVTSKTRLSDDLKKRVLTTFLTLMNLQENIDRCNSRFLCPRLLYPRPPRRIVPAMPLMPAVRA
jgi:hypothetical protein